jgi:hypothetical protein
MGKTSMSALGAVLACSLLAGAGPRKPFTIRVVDDRTGRGVPLVELRTVHGVKLFTDSAGVAAFDEPGLMGRSVFFHVASHGYEMPRDGFGYRGKALKVTPGGSAKLAVRRTNIAERLYRVTGAGIYRDSVLAGLPVPLAEPLLNGQVLGSDSVVNIVHAGKVRWFWGDTNRPGYPLGNFHVPGATSRLPADGGLDPEVGVDLTYLVDDKGFARATCRMPGKGPTWLTSLVTLPGPGGKEKLYGSYVKVEPPLKVYARGLAAFDDDRQEFTHLADLDFKAPAYPEGHAFRHAENGTEHVYFCHPYPLTRVKATLEDFRRPERYETWTCLKEGSSLNRPEVERDAAGRVRYGWKRNTAAVGPAAQAKLIRSGKLKAREAALQLRDRDTGKAVQAHSGSVYWNAYRKRWVLIAVELGGTSLLGEVWHAEADAPTGPWAYAVKVVTHERYSFYNPKQHPMFDKHGGRVIFFEGTYTHTFSGNPEATPRYDYNQVMYRLDLADERLALPVPIYDLPEGKGAPLGTIHAAGVKAGRPVAFFALDRPVAGMVPLLPAEGGLRVGKPLGEARPAEGALFYALPADAKEPPGTTVPLYEYRQDGAGRRIYATAADLKQPGYRRAERPLCRVWRSPWGE